MNYSLQFRPAFRVVGISVRTSNQTPHQIGELWQKFYAQGVAAQIPHSETSELYSLYTEYDGDWRAPFTVVIGYPATDDAPPPGLVSKPVPAATYAVFEASGKQPDAVIAAWRTIWDSPLRRRYSGDFEVYSPQPGGAPGEVKIFVAVEGESPADR